MIELGAEHTLGRKSFFLLLSRKAGIAGIFILVSLILFSVNGAIIRSLASVLSFSGGRSAALVTASSAVSYLILGLFLLGILLFLAGLIVSRLQYNNYTFSFSEFDLHLRRGILNKTETSIPYRQIQDVNIERSISHQMLGLSKVVMTTAGHEEAGEQGMSEIVLEPIDKDLAEEIRSLLERKIGVQVVEDQTVADKEAVQMQAVN